MSEHQEQIDKARLAAKTALGHIAALQSSEAFAWFMRECVNVKTDEERELALSAKSTDQESRDARMRYAALLSIAGWTRIKENELRIIAEVKNG